MIKRKEVQKTYFMKLPFSSGVGSGTLGVVLPLSSDVGSVAIGVVLPLSSGDDSGALGVVIGASVVSSKLPEN